MSKILKYKILLGIIISLFSLVFIFVLLIPTFFPLINSDWSFNGEVIILILICSISLGVLTFIAVYYADKIKELKRKWKRNN